jgi:hypothetical protein
LKVASEDRQKENRDIAEADDTDQRGRPRTHRRHGLRSWRSTSAFATRGCISSMRFNSSIDTHSDVAVEVFHLEGIAL